jgi:hypothetical protein
MARLQRWLPRLMSAVAGTADVIGFLSLKLFTAHQNRYRIVYHEISLHLSSIVLREELALF